LDEWYLLEVSLASGNMERVPATVISGVAAPEAGHAERPAHLHHAILVARVGSQPLTTITPSSLQCADLARGTPHVDRL